MAQIASTHVALNIFGPCALFGLKLIPTNFQVAISSVASSSAAERAANESGN
jgi:hypothetical protein